jgi:hypothetical protein
MHPNGNICKEMTGGSSFRGPVGRLQTDLRDHVMNHTPGGVPTFGQRQFKPRLLSLRSAHTKCPFWSTLEGEDRPNPDREPRLWLNEAARRGSRALRCVQLFLFKSWFRARDAIDIQL